MEILDEKNVNASASNENLITDIALKHLQATAPWMLFAGIVGTIFASIVILYLIILLIQIMPYISIIGFGTILGMLIVYGVFGGVYLYISTLLIQYANKIKAIAYAPSASEFEEAFNVQRKYWLVYGIILIVFLVLLLISLVSNGSSFRLRM